MAGGWDPDAFLTGELNEMGLDPDEYGMYFDSYDFTPERLDRMDYSQGIQSLKGRFEASSIKLDKEVDQTGFESSFMADEAERSLYDQYFGEADALGLDLAGDVFGKQKQYKEQTWGDIQWLMELDPDLGPGAEEEE